jgi:hypothetical protein
MLDRRDELKGKVVHPEEALNMIVWLCQIRPFAAVLQLGEQLGYLEILFVRILYAQDLMGVGIRLDIPHSLGLGYGEVFHASTVLR